MKQFWDWVKDETTESRTLYLNGAIAEESWFDDDVTPQAFKADLFAGEGDISLKGKRLRASANTLRA